MGSESIFEIHLFIYFCAAEQNKIIIRRKNIKILDRKELKKWMYLKYWLITDQSICPDTLNTNVLNFAFPPPHPQVQYTWKNVRNLNIIESDWFY